MFGFIYNMRVVDIMLDVNFLFLFYSFLRLRRVVVFFYVEVLYVRKWVKYIIFI